jgi:hypothetical protein
VRGEGYFRAYRLLVRFPEQFFDGVALRAQITGSSLIAVVPLAALDIPLKVLVWEDKNGAVSVSYNSPGFLAGRHHLEGALRAPFDAVESIVEALSGA